MTVPHIYFPPYSLAVKKEAGVAKKAKQKSEDGNDDEQPSVKKIKKFVEEMRKETDKKSEVSIIWKSELFNSIITEKNGFFEAV